MVPNDPALAVFPPELIARVADQAARDADLVAHILDAVGLAPPQGGVRQYPAEFLLELGAAARLLAWESGGLMLHLEAGLPAAHDALVMTFLDAARRLTDPSDNAPVRPLRRAVLCLTIDRLAWVGPRDLGAEILLETPDEGALVDAMAQLLWAWRHKASSGNRGATP